MERDLKFCLCGNPSEKQIRKSGLIVYRGICSTCLTLKRRNIPDYVNKEWLEQKHIKDNLSLEQIAIELNIKESHCLHLFKIYNIEEIKHCKYCNTTENLRQCKVNNKWMNEKEAVHKICQSCYEKMKSEKQKEAAKKINFEESKKKYNQHYINNPDKKKLETEKANKTKANKPEDIKQAEIERMRQTKLSKSDEEKQGIIEKFKETMNNKTDEEKQLRLERMGKGVSENHQNRTQESWDESRRKSEETWNEKYNGNFYKIRSQKFSDTWNKKSSHEIRSIREKQLNTYIQNESKHQRYLSISAKATKLFIELDNYFNNKINFEYGLLSEDRKTFINRERGIYVYDLFLSNNKYRFFDFFFKNNKHERIVFEFDEYAHNKLEIKLDDITREIEIFLKYPNLKLFRISEEYFDKNYKIMFDDIVNLIEDQNSKTYFNYDNLIKKLCIKNPPSS